MNRPMLDSYLSLRWHVHELVRGQAQPFIDQLRPIVHHQSVRLDLVGIERIDAAGLAALISLYREARQTGHEFDVANPSRQVARVLAIAGLDRLLAARTRDEDPPRALAAA